MEDKIRYGKILHDMPEAELRYYNPSKPDLELRGRVKILQGVIGLLIYQKIASGRYKAIETNTANSHGALYDNLWKFLWKSAAKPSTDDIKEYKSNYTGDKK